MSPVAFTLRLLQTALQPFQMIFSHPFSQHWPGGTQGALWGGGGVHLNPLTPSPRLWSCTFSIICKLMAPELPSAVPFDDLASQHKSHFITKPSYHNALCDFLQRKKKSSESVKEYYAELKLLAHQCEFNNDFDRCLKEQLLVGIDNEVYFKVL